MLRMSVVLVACILSSRPRGSPSLASVVTENTPRSSTFSPRESTSTTNTCSRAWAPESEFEFDFESGILNSIPLDHRMNQTVILYNYWYLVYKPRARIKGGRVFGAYLDHPGNGFPLKGWSPAPTRQVTEHEPSYLTTGRQRLTRRVT
jgi:hypothetical protein